MNAPITVSVANYHGSYKSYPVRVATRVPIIGSSEGCCVGYHGVPTGGYFAASCKACYEGSYKGYSTSVPQKVITSAPAFKVEGSCRVAYETLRLALRVPVRSNSRVSTRVTTQGGPFAGVPTTKVPQPYEDSEKGCYNCLGPVVAVEGRQGHGVLVWKY